MPAHVRQTTPPGRRDSGHGLFSAAVGVIGELLITAGVFLGFFVVWQLWWTDVEAGQQHRAVIEGLQWEPAPAPSAAASAAPPVERRDAPPVMAEPEEGTIFAVLYIPRFGANYVAPVAQGIDKRLILDRLGAGHYLGTAMPGDLGNFALAGHRTTYGKPFNKIADLVPGDAMVVRTNDTWYVYKMTSNLIVNPDQGEVVAPIPGTKVGDPLVEPTQRLITLTACHPMFSAKERFIAHGEFDYWLAVSDGVPKELTEAGVDITIGAPTTQGAA